MRAAANHAPAFKASSMLEQGVTHAHHVYENTRVRDETGPKRPVYGRVRCQNHSDTFFVNLERLFGTLLIRSSVSKLAARSLLSGGHYSSNHTGVTHLA